MSVFSSLKKAFKTRESANFPNDLESLWMPFSANKDFKKNPRLISKAKGMYYYTPSGEKILDGVAGLWCCNAGHNREPIVEAIKKQAEELDFAPAFNMGHPKSFELSSKLSQMAPSGFNHVFFGNSGSEAVESALKIALSYWREKGKENKKILIGRNRGYHGTNFGGVSVGGIEKNRNQFNKFLPDVYHLKDTHNLKKNAFSKGQPSWGEELANELDEMIKNHGSDNIAAVIVEPVAGSTGVLIPPKNYLNKIKKICDQNNILLIFDEVITGWGRTGSSFAGHEFGVTPDIMTMAKATTNGVVPMGVVACKDEIYDAVMDASPMGSVELFHGYTYSGIPVAVAAGLAVQDIFEKEDIFNRAKNLAPYFQKGLFSLQDLESVENIRGYGMMGGIDMKMNTKPGKAGYECFKACYEAGVNFKATGDCLIIAPQFICEEKHIDEIIDKLRTGITNYQKNQKN